MTKPHLTRANGYWRCQGQGVDGYGVTMTGAFEQWRAMLPKPARARATLPSPSAMLAALAMWEPDRAH